MRSSVLDYTKQVLTLFFSDLDTIASSVAFAWIQTEVHKKPTIPLIRIDRDDLNLRAENIYALQLAGINNPAEQLLLQTDIKELKPFPSNQFALVDHNRLGAEFISQDPVSEVTAVVDHHEDENLYKDTANPRIISPAGSCSSHIASLCPPELPAELATLLICAILIDTAALKPGGKATKVDYNAVAFLLPKSTLKASAPFATLSQLSDTTISHETLLTEDPALRDLNKELSKRKADLSHLTPWDLLRRDYKEYTYTLNWHPAKPSIKAGLSTVPVRLESWWSDGKLQTEGEGWMKHRDLCILGVLTSFQDASTMRKNGKGKHRREMLWIIRTDSKVTYKSSTDDSDTLDFEQLAQRLWDGLEASNEVQLKVHKKFSVKKVGAPPANLKRMVYKQGNAAATRKVTAPLLKTILEDTGSRS